MDRQAEALDRKARELNLVVYNVREIAEDSGHVQMLDSQ